MLHSNLFFLYFVYFPLHIVVGQSGTRSLRFNCAGNLLSDSSNTPASSNNNFRLSVAGDPQSYQPSQQYTVTLQSSLPASFRGFAIRAIPDEDDSAGVFEPRNVHTAQIMTSCSNVATHVNYGKKTRVQVLWTAPSSGCVRLSASVLQKGSIWFKDDDRLGLRLCPQNMTAASPTVNQHECCACGSATYRMTFYGLWSPQTHPKDYPAFSTHWSNIIGASHSRSYVIWEYGGYASEAVQKVAEWGWSDNLEEEIRAQSSDDVMSVIKTKAQWPAYQPRNLREPPSDTFEVDSSRHLVSLLTMLGPSPDWNVGVSGRSMCSEACGWVGRRSFDLIPWDAGTDSGVTYMAANSPTNPHEPIRNLTTSDDPLSPFFNPNGGVIPPVARVVIRRLAIKGDQCGESEDVNEGEDLEVPLSPSHIPLSPSCMYAEWSGWSDCAVTCGWGIKMKTRMVKFGGDACQATTEKEICRGAGQCWGGSVATVCLYSEWSEWSPCSATCGNSVRFRVRELKWPSEPENCGEPLKEMSECANQDCGCVYTPWSDWMSCPVTCGVGQTIRKRSLVSSGLECSSVVMETSQCMTSMFCGAVERETRGCTYTPWSDWSDCPVSCGVGRSVRKRLLQSASVPSCESVIMETSKCMTSSECPNTCNYGDWSDWMPCSVTCGEGDTMRKKFLTSSDGNDCENVVIERSTCRNQPCESSTASQCVYLPWTGWMPCSTSCGKGETLRKRFLNQSASYSSCQSFEMETNLCTVACDVTETSQCVYSDWTVWSMCRRSCKKFRKKFLRQASGEKKCKRVAKERTRCSGGRCRGSCSLSEWSDWSSCSRVCNTRDTRVHRFQTRVRKPLNEVTRTSRRRRCRRERQKRRCVC